MIYMEHRAKMRFYWLILQQDILGTWCVKTVSGGLVNAKRREMIIPYSSRLEAAQALTELEYAHRQRGYIYADTQNVDSFALTPQTIDEVLTAAI